MNNNDYLIRRETPADHRIVENLVRESFWNVYRPGCVEHFVLKCLRDAEAFVPELDFVMVKDGEIIGQNVFVKAEIRCSDGASFPILTMGPICVAPEWKRQGFGKKLLDFSLEQAAKYGAKAVCFEGNIDFYGKSGFVVASSFGLRYHGLPEGADDSFFLCRELLPHALDAIRGEYTTPSCYFAAEENPDGFARYEAAFPSKEKKKLPGQIFNG